MFKIPIQAPIGGKVDLRAKNPERDAQGW